MKDVGLSATCLALRQEPDETVLVIELSKLGELRLNGIAQVLVVYLLLQQRGELLPLLLSLRIGCVVFL